MRLWEQEPDETHYRQWLESCFRENMAVLFSGDIQFMSENTQRDLLADLHEELEPLSVQELMGEDFNESDQLAELWDNTPDALNLDRPWMKRMGRLLDGANS